MQGTEAEFLQTIDLLLSKDNRRRKSQWTTVFSPSHFIENSVKINFKQRMVVE